MIIGNYEVVINEEVSRCAIIVNSKELDSSIIKDQELEYEVAFKDCEIKIFNKETGLLVVTFKNANEELLRYAIKSNGFPLCIGTVKTQAPQIEFETFISMK